MTHQWRDGVGCPLPLAMVLIGERFGIPPWEIEQAPADRVTFYLNVMSAEATTHELVDDLPNDETLIRDV